MSEIDQSDDDALRFIQRVLESNAPKEDRDRAVQMVRDIRTRVLKEYASKLERRGAVGLDPVSAAILRGDLKQ